MTKNKSKGNIKEKLWGNDKKFGILGSIFVRLLATATVTYTVNYLFGIDFKLAGILLGIFFAIVIIIHEWWNSKSEISQDETIKFCLSLFGIIVIIALCWWIFGLVGGGIAGILAVILLLKIL